MEEEFPPIIDETNAKLLSDAELLKAKQAYEAYAEGTGVDLKKMRQEKRIMDKAAAELRDPLWQETVRRRVYGVFSAVCLSFIGFAAAAGAADAAGILRPPRPVQLAQGGGEPQIRAGATK